MTIQQFIQKDNVNMLWEVISDEEIFKFLSRDIQGKIYQLFINNIQGFFENERLKTNSLVDINKKYILLILNHIRKSYPIQPNKITIYNEPVKENITFEEIQNERKSKFDRDFSKKQEEFEEIMTLKVPPVPEFADKDKDSPIKEMDKILKEIQAQRNYDIEQINKNHISTDNWLKPQETSLKSEKFISQKETQQSQRFKFLNNLEEDTSPIIKDKKNVSFSNIEEVNTFNDEDEEHDNIFLKLKKVSKKEPENINIQINEKTNLNEQTILNEDRISKLEREVMNINTKMDKILELLSKN